MKRLKLRHVLFLMILLAGIVPLAVSTAVLTGPNRDILRTKEQTDLTRTAESLSRDVDSYLASARRDLELIGGAMLAQSAEQPVPELLREPWAQQFLESFANRRSGWKLLTVVDPQGRGPSFGSLEISGDLLTQVRASFSAALESGRTDYRFVELGGEEPAVVLTVPATSARSGDNRTILLEAVVQPPRLLEDLAPAEDAARANDVTYLIDRSGGVIWASHENLAQRVALESSELVRSFVRRPLPLTQILPVTVGGETQSIIAIVSPIEATGWGVVVYRPESSAFVSVRRLLLTALISFLVMVMLALIIAFGASGWIGQPIQRLAETTHAIAQGDFSSRVDTQGLRFELADLANDFNQMGGTVESYVAQLRLAAQANRDLFIGSLKAFTAAIDAKDPYTRGHSERVAAYSRVISRYLGQSEDFQHRLWIAALLHDVGKIGVEDRVLKKSGVLSQDEYEQIKMHTVIGYDIMQPIEQLREALPVIRWHHENWNGRGYPDGLKGEQIPLMARIVAVADTFDAITTNRPYQKAYTLEYAVETITKLTGARFDAKVVTAFLRAVDKGEVRILQKPQDELPTDAVAPPTNEEQPTTVAAGS
ncbi:MAG: HD domain-containing phosphohydrolase [Acidobacteriota bacterium]